MCTAARWYDDLLPTTEIITKIEDSACSALPSCKPSPCLPPDHPNYNLPYSQGAPGALWDLLQWTKNSWGHNLDAVVGPACSGASNAAAYFGEEFQVPLISYSATSKSLSGRSPYFFRLSMPDSEKSLRVVDFLQEFDWEYAGTISTDTAYGKDMAASFKNDWLGDYAKAADGNKLEFNRIIDTSTDDAAFEAATLDVMKSLDSGGGGRVTRVMVLCGHTNDVAKILEKIYELDEGGTASSTVYIATTDSPPVPGNGWPENLKGDGLFSVVVKDPDGSNTLSSNYRREWAAEARPGSTFATQHGRSPEDSDGNLQTLHTYSWNTHDAVVAVATAYHRMKQHVQGGGGDESSLRDYIESVTTEPRTRIITA